MKIFESPLSDASGQDFRLYANCLWNVVITICTVGYGDIYPKTHLGRLVGIISCFWGFFVISMMVVTLGQIVNFTNEEESAYKMFRRLEYADNIRSKAIKALSSAFKKIILSKKSNK